MVALRQQPDRITVRKPCHNKRQEKKKLQLPPNTITGYRELRTRLRSTGKKDRFDRLIGEWQHYTVDMVYDREAHAFVPDGDTSPVKQSAKRAEENLPDYMQLGAHVHVQNALVSSRLVDGKRIGGQRETFYGRFLWLQGDRAAVLGWIKCGVEAREGVGRKKAKRHWELRMVDTSTLHPPGHGLDLPPRLPANLEKSLQF